MGCHFHWLSFHGYAGSVVYYLFQAVDFHNCWPSFPCMELWVVADIHCEFGLLIYPGLGVVAAELFWPR